MASRPLTQLEEVELTLIQQDANDVVRVLLGPKHHEKSDFLAFSTLPLVGLFAEESFRYLSRASSPIPAPSTQLFANFASTVTKTRARIKLFEDTDGYSEGLIDALEVAHSKSVDWFCAPHRGVLRSWIRRIQPDLGIFFAGESPIATSHTILPTVGFTLDELRELTPARLERLGQRMFSFSCEFGRHLRAIATSLEPLGRSIQLQPNPLPLNAIQLSQNDFIGAKLYKRASEALHPIETRFVGSVIMAAAQVNSAVRVLPHLLTPESNLLLRIQFLTLFHSQNLLTTSVPALMSRLPTLTEREGRTLGSRPFRNICAHYGLRGAAAQAAVGADDSFGAVVHAFTGMRRAELRELLERRLLATSTLLDETLAKSRLAPIRALFGEHS